MKIFLIILCFIPIFLHSQIKFKSHVDIGVTNWSKKMYNDVDFWRTKSAPVSFYSSLVFKAYYKKISITNELDTYMDKSKKAYTFVPLLTTYTIRAEIKYKYGIIGIEHSCTHPIITSPITDNKKVFRASHDRLFIRFEI